jgi:hypothetical protein
VLGASPSNVEPREGTTYAVVNLLARNTGNNSIQLDNDDFALTGDSGLVVALLGARPPDPVLNVSLAPGSRLKAGLRSAFREETSLLLVFDSLELEGTWADRVLALQDGAQIRTWAAPGGFQWRRN